MKIQIATESYNNRRYGKPWIARVNFTTNPKGDFEWGDWVGDPGSSGLSILECEEGDVIARGQKDNRQPRNSAPRFYLAGDAGTLTDISRTDAYLHANQ